MLVDLNDFRPKNETFEHFFLKQIGRAYLFDQGIRCIATEVEGVTGQDHPTFGGHKSVIDVLGIVKRSRRDDLAHKLYRRIHHMAVELGSKYNLVEPSYNGELMWRSEFRFNGEEQTAFLTMREYCFEQVCESLGYPRDLHKKLHWAYADKYEMRGIEAKASYSDFKNGFSMTAEYSYVIAPKGVVPVEELPKKVGMLEFDFDLYNANKDWRSALIVSRKPKKEYDSMFYLDSDKKKKFNITSHAQFCHDLIFKIAQQNTEESVFWNPHIVQIDEGYSNSKWDFKFELKIGDSTEWGIVVDRREGKNPDKEDKYYGNRYMNFYKMVKEGVGMTKWIPYSKIEKVNGLLVSRRKQSSIF